MHKIRRYGVQRLSCGIFHRFWYENPGVFTPSQLSEIKQTTLSRVLCDNGDDIRQVQKDAFSMAKYPAEFLDCEDEFAVPKLDLKVWAHCCQGKRLSIILKKYLHTKMYMYIIHHWTYKYIIKFLDFNLIKNLNTCKISM